MIDKAFATETLQQLVRINSVNPDLEEGGPGEEHVARYIYDLLEELGIEVEWEELAPRRVNVTGYLRAGGQGEARKGEKPKSPSFMLNAHMDTVGVSGMQDPFSGRIVDGQLYGRGAYDMKGSITAILAAAKAIKEESIELGGDLVLSFVADEEYESIGAQALVQKLTTDAAIVAEPSDLNICLAHRGFGIFKITTTGQTAHGGNHHLGRDANMRMGRLLAELEPFARQLTRQNSHPLCGEGSMHVPLVEGGRSLFLYSDRCTIHIERRLLPGETRQAVEQDYQAIIDRLNAQDETFEAKLKTALWRSPYEVDRNAPIVRHLDEAWREAAQEAVELDEEPQAEAGSSGGASHSGSAEGSQTAGSPGTGEAHAAQQSTWSKGGTYVQASEPGYIGHTWWEDSAFFGEAGIETVIIGPEGGGIHEDVEWTDVNSVVRLADVMKRTAERYCR